MNTKNLKRVATSLRKKIAANAAYEVLSSAVGPDLLNALHDLDGDAQDQAYELFQGLLAMLPASVDSDFVDAAGKLHDVVTRRMEADATRNLLGKALNALGEPTPVMF